MDKSALQSVGGRLVIAASCPSQVSVLCPALVAAAVKPSLPGGIWWLLWAELVADCIALLCFRVDSWSEAPHLTHLKLHLLASTIINSWQQIKQRVPNWPIQIRDKGQGRESQAGWDKIPTFGICYLSPKPILCALPLSRTKLWANSQILCPNVQMSKASEMYDVPLSTWQGAAQSEYEYVAARGEFCFQWIFPEPELTGQLSPRCVSCFRTPSYSCSCSTCSKMQYKHMNEYLHLYHKVRLLTPTPKVLKTAIFTRSVAKLSHRSTGWTPFHLVLFQIFIEIWHLL